MYIKIYIYTHITYNINNTERGPLYHACDSFWKPSSKLSFIFCFFKRCYFQVIVTPNMGLNSTWRSRVTCSSNWASQVPLNYPIYKLFSYKISKHCFHCSDLKFLNSTNTVARGLSQNTQVQITAPQLIIPAHPWASYFISCALVSSPKNGKSKSTHLAGLLQKLKITHIKHLLVHRLF